MYKVGDTVVYKNAMFAEIVAINNIGHPGVYTYDITIGHAFYANVPEADLSPVSDFLPKEEKPKPAPPNHGWVKYTGIIK
jgi:hypothetical protein